MTTIEEEKYILRKRIERLRGELKEEDSREKSELACKRLIEHPLFADQQDYSKLTLCTYMPFRSELDITPVMEWCWKKGVKVLIPKANRLQKSLHLHCIESYADVATGAWGIREPRDTAVAWDQITSIDIMLVPGLAFDLQGGRLGYGGGYYDRFVRNCERTLQTKPVYAAVAFDTQLVEQVPMEDHDLRINKIFTESGTVK
jgi:5-formyltetrahydrofolate cyclo-ligase